MKNYPHSWGFSLPIVGNPKLKLVTARGALTKLASLPINIFLWMLAASFTF
jgi:hypothetical protein